MRNGKTVSGYNNLTKKDRSKPLDLTSMFVKNNMGQLIKWITW
jgi:HAE1 family hydrophobic/amphiphilic exporter-1/multidrug efflux pump